MLFRQVVGVAVACCFLPAGAVAGTLEVTPAPLQVPQAHTPCADTTALAGQVSSRRLRLATLCLMNAERAAQGLSPLHASRALRRAARSHLRNMATRGYFAHNEPSGRTVLDRARASGYLHGSGCGLVGENLGWGQGIEATPGSMDGGWMSSTLHRANILDRGYHDVGIAIGQRGDTITYVIDFGGC
jgi:uncharacterized protein YkwD